MYDYGVYDYGTGATGVNKDMTEEASGIKYDDDKLRYDLIPPAALEALAFVYTIGARKYDDWNWLKGMKWSRVYGALMRHLMAWVQGEQFDQDDGQEHLASIAWCAFTLMEYERLEVGTDDRMYQLVLFRGTEADDASGLRVVPEGGSVQGMGSHLLCRPGRPCQHYPFPPATAPFQSLEETGR